MGATQANALLVLNRDDLKVLIRELWQEIKREATDDLLDEEAICDKFHISISLVKSLYEEGKIGRYPMDGHPKVHRYSESEIRSTFIYQRKNKD